LSHEEPHESDSPGRAPARRSGPLSHPTRIGVLLTVLGVGLCALAGLAGLAGAHTGAPRASRASGAPRAALAAAAPRARSKVPTHIETWAFDDGCNGGSGASGALVRSALTFAESECGPNATKALNDCHAGGRHGCTVVQYMDTDWNFTVERVNTGEAGNPSWWLHSPGGGHSRIFSPTFGGGYLLNQSNPDVRRFFQDLVRRSYNNDDALLLDWQSSSLSQELYYSTCNCRMTHEITSNTTLRHWHEVMSAALTRRNGSHFIEIDNTLPNNPYLPQGFDMLKPAIGVYGWSVEGMPENYGVLDPYYSTLLDQIAYVATRTKGFIVPMARAQAGAADQAQTRRVQEATMLLGYSPGHLVDWGNMETGSTDLAVWPEEGIYPTKPIESMRAPGGRGCLAGTGVVCSRGGHNSVQVARGVYRREFRSCYLDGAPFGRCATIMNTLPRPVVVRRSWLRGAYANEITFVGGDMESRGKVNLSGAPFSAGSTTIPAQDAVLLSH
jgi:hypothetical protein